MVGMNPINTANPVGLSLYTDRTTYANKVKVIFNGNLLGKIAYSDSINWQWNHAGVKGHFYYQNNTLFGLDDDTADSTMNNSDGLADVSGYLTNGATSYSLTLEQEYLPPHPYASNGGYKNVNLLFINAYTTPCDTFSTSISADTVICKGDSVQLFASGGTNYYWLPQAGLSNPNSANPIATPDTTTLYVVRIENTPGCSRTEKVLVKVNPLPKINAITITPSVCGNDDGQITIHAAGNNPLQYSIGNGFKTDNTFLNLSTGNYTLTVLDNNACTYDTTVWVPETNPVAALFSASPPSGTEPLFVNLNNQSLKANHYVWLVENTFLSNAYNSSYTFDSAGVYTVTLIAYNNIPQCADTFSLQIVVYDSLVLQIPNVFTPNNDGMNDTFTIKVEGVKELSVAIFNRWGNLMKEYRSTLNLSPTIINLWDGRSATGEAVPEGVYFYVINVSDIKDEQRKYSGTIHLFK
jgi:gliding motility-associated-like protein